MKKFFSLALCLVYLLTIFVLSGCGGDPAGPSGPVDPATTGELTFDEDGNVVFDEVELKLSTVVVGDDKPALTTLIAKFNAAYRGKINIYPTYIAQDVYETTVESQVSNNSNAPDIIMSHVKAHKSFADNGIIQSLNNAIEKSGIELDLTDYADGLASYSSCGYEGKIYTIPADMQTMCVYYNKDLLESTGLSLPTTRAELFAVCEAVMEQNSNVTYPISAASTQEFFSWYVFPTALLQNGAVFYDEDTYRANWADGGANQAAIEKGIESLRELFYDKQYMKYGLSSSEALNAFLNNQSLFYFGLPWGTESLLTSYGNKYGLTAEQTQEKLGVTSLAGWFAMSDSESAGLLYGDAHFFAMTSTVTDITKQAAICEFIRWYTQETSTGIAWAEAGHLSANKTVSASEAYNANAFITNYVKPIYGDINNFRSAGITPYYKDLQAQLTGMYVYTVGATTLSDLTRAIKTYQDNLNTIIEFAEM